MQKQLEEDADAFNLIFSQVQPHFIELMNNPFGNYLCQKLTERMTDDQLTEVLNMIKTKIIWICQN